MIKSLDIGHLEKKRLPIFKTQLHAVRGCSQIISATELGRGFGKC